MVWVRLVRETGRESGEKSIRERGTERDSEREWVELNSTERDRHRERNRQTACRGQNVSLSSV